MKKLWRKYNVSILSSVLGAVIGYYYWKYYGCENGCTIKSNPRLMILYGLILGFLSGDLMKSIYLKIRKKH